MSVLAVTNNRKTEEVSEEIEKLHINNIRNNINPYHANVENMVSYY